MNRNSCHYALIAMMAAASATSAVGQTRRTGLLPAPGLETVASVGSPIVDRFSYIAAPGARLEADVDVGLGVQGRIRVQSGSELYLTQTGRSVRACTVDQNTFANGVGQSGESCFIDREADGRFDRVSGSLMFTSRNLNPPISYRLVDIVQADVRDNLRMRLIFLGTAPGVIRASYREFNGDMARPAFTEELTFPLANSFPQTFTWRDTRITVLAVDGNGLRYRIEP